MPHTKKNNANSEIIQSLNISMVPSGFPVGFCLLTHDQQQYVAYFDSKHRMTVASRRLDDDEWRYQVLPSKVSWDSHNYLTMAVDDDRHLHMAGNMHCTPLIYYRTTLAGDNTSLTRIPTMIGSREKKCTYPKFMRGNDGKLIFHYRDGSSGDGVEIYNIYDPKSQQWSRLLDTPLIDGEGKMNAYMSGPTLGPDGVFHLCWVWRDTPHCETNHDPSYACSKDLKCWETIDGNTIDLPITIRTPGVLIDPVPIEGGIINGALHIGFDNARKPVASYHKFDHNGKTQIYLARFRDGQWISKQITRWNYRWEFTGKGSIDSEIKLRNVQPCSGGYIALHFQHIEYGDGLLVIDEKDFNLFRTESITPQFPEQLKDIKSKKKRMLVNWAEDSGAPIDVKDRYVLRWETLPHNRDRMPKRMRRKHSILELYKIKKNTRKSDHF